MNDVTPDTLFRTVDLIGVVANSLLGGAVARGRGYDMIGFLFLAISSALGGGIMRDVMLSIGFPVALTDPFYLTGAIAGAVIAYFIVLDDKFSRVLLSVADVLALGCWSATGASKALAAGLGWVPAIFIGVLTAVGGGVLRDVMTNQEPSVFGGQPVYATLSIFSSIAMVVLQSNGLYAWGMGLAIALAGVLGLLARWQNWQLPGAATLVLPRPSLSGRRRPAWLRRRRADEDED
ncbi:Uncharacterized membrane protein YeiH [Raineyella antarctica]|uniref:Uncharacterized membrane protein YeiH n=1 Tax=Raineyella antarctica TaxID=1577474 RepID=A0A1G6GDE4_9ACTN|nr:TRIC cation channel family protein [Raineyella antarctica]SDB80011.1 Uncharacterized membrane protein YeiH [Raineyella antarctica]